MSSYEEPPWYTGVQAVLAQRARYRKGWEEAGFWSAQTLYDRIGAGIAQWPAARLIYCSEARPSETTLRQALTDSEIIARSFVAQGLCAGDVIVVQVPHWREGMLTWLAALQLGLVVVPIVHIYGAAELGFVLRQTRAKALVTPASWRKIDYAARFEVVGETPDLSFIAVIGTEPFPGPAISWDELFRRGESLVPAPTHRASPDDVCTIIYTSGTTSVPKGALHTHNTLGAELKSVHHWWEDYSPRAALAAMPAGHIAGILIMMRPFILGGDSIHIDQWDPSVAVELIHRYGIRTSTGTPFHANSLFDAAATRGVAPLSDMMIGGASVPPSTVTRADAVGVCIARAYGSTEHPTISTGKPYDRADQRANTDGRIMDLIQLRFLDDDNNEVAPGMAGEIISMGPDLCVGYFDASLNDAAFMADGGFRTGDIGVLDEAGMLTIVDRKKDIIIRGGENISSREVEDILARHPAVLEAAVLGWPDQVMGEKVGAFLRLAPGVTIDLAEVRRHFQAAGVAKQKTPEQIRIVEDFPRTPSGKVKKVDLRKHLT
ncbi:MAG: cyclohexanecarboxylate-CoA ligase [Rhodospirillaceae bacterium]|nr:MAG: cyclohexanecarboxylate-CoA ligase [Rhodospirillaceae bacterium]